MAGTLTVDTIQSDSSYASRINVTSNVAFTSPVNFTGGMQLGGQDTTFGGVRNRIINGAMSIAQYGTSTTVALGGNTGYSCDRFRCDASVGTAITTAQSTSVVPTGFAYSLSYTAGTGTTAAGDNPEIVHFIEGYNIVDLSWGTANAQSVTLSFWARSSLTGSFGLILENSDASVQYLTTYSLPVVNTWTKITLSIPAPTIGTWQINNTRGIGIRWDMGVGTTNSGASTNAWNTTAAPKVGVTGTVKITQNTGATFHLTGVQLEKGSAATAFEQLHYGHILTLCQRYYYKSYEIGVTPGTNTGTGAISGRNWDPGSGRTTLPVTAHHKVEMRTTPTVVFYTIPGLAGSVSAAGDPTAHAGSLAVNATYSLTTKIIGGIDVATAVSASQFFNFHYTASAEL